MKSIACFVLSLGFWLSVANAEWSLDRSPEVAAARNAVTPAKPTIDERVHLGLDRNEQNDTLIGELPALPSVAAGALHPTAQPGLVSNVDAPGTAITGTSPMWSNGNGAQTVTLDAPTPTRAVATLVPALPVGVTRDSGVPDAVVYLGLGVLLLALVWVCMGGMRNRRSPQIAPNYGGGERQRVQRVKMVALKVQR